MNTTRHFCLAPGQEVHFHRQGNAVLAKSLNEPGGELSHRDLEHLIVPRVQTPAYVHGVFVLNPTTFTFWRVSALAPVVKLNVFPAKVRHMFCQPDTIHLGIAGHGSAKSVPPNQIKILTPNNILSVIECLCCMVSPVCLQSLTWIAMNSITGKGEFHKFEGKITLYPRAA
jgi:hypothetical protein